MKATVASPPPWGSAEWTSSPSIHPDPAGLARPEVEPAAVPKARWLPVAAEPESRSGRRRRQRHRLELVGHADGLGRRRPIVPSSPASVPRAAFGGGEHSPHAVAAAGQPGEGLALLELFEPDPPLGGAGGRTDIVTSTAAALL